MNVINLLKERGIILTGHFILSSGLHSPNYIQCAKIFEDAKFASELCAQLAQKVINEFDIGSFNIVVSPAMGGILCGYELSRHLKIPNVFVERVNGVFQLRRGFELKESHKVLIVEDVVTTGKSSMEAADVIRSHGADIIGVASIIDRRIDDTNLPYTLVSLVKMDVPVFQPDDLPEYLQNMPAIKPGSRGIK